MLPTFRIAMLLATLTLAGCSALRPPEPSIPAEPRPHQSQGDERERFEAMKAFIDAGMKKEGEELMRELLDEGYPPALHLLIGDRDCYFAASGNQRIPDIKRPSPALLELVRQGDELGIWRAWQCVTPGSGNTAVSAALMRDSYGVDAALAYMAEEKGNASAAIELYLYHAGPVAWSGRKLDNDPRQLEEELVRGDPRFPNVKQAQHWALVTAAAAEQCVNQDAPTPRLRDFCFDSYDPRRTYPSGDQQRWLTSGGSAYLEQPIAIARLFLSEGQIEAARDWNEEGKRRLRRVLSMGDFEDYIATYIRIVAAVDHAIEHESTR